MYSGGMSEWNYTKCAKPFQSESDAEIFMSKHDFAGYLLKRTDGYAAVCPAYPDGYYPDAVVVREVENKAGELAIAKAKASVSCC
jgi:hypothetical protein